MFKEPTATSFEVQTHDLVGCPNEPKIDLLGFSSLVDSTSDTTTKRP